MTEIVATNIVASQLPKRLTDWNADRSLQKEIIGKKKWSTKVVAI